MSSSSSGTARRRPRQRGASDPRQLELFAAAAPVAASPAGTAAEAGSAVSLIARRAALARRLDRWMGGRLAALVLTDNRRMLLSARRARSAPAAGPEAQGLAVRIDWTFLTAPDSVVRAAAGLIRGPSRPSAAVRAARAAIRDWAAGERERGATAPAGVAPRRRAPARPQTPPRTRGRSLDLAALCDAINERCFGGRLAVAIEWGRATPLRRRRARRRQTLHLGTWSETARLVRIHPVLDHPSVPEAVVAAVVHHELLHAALGEEIVGGRRRVHGEEFRRREREFAEHAEAERWIRAHLGELLARRAGRLARKSARSAGRSERRG